MSRAALSTGTAGGIMGTITAIMGMLWSLWTLNLASQLNLNIASVPFAAPLNMTPFVSGFLWFSLILALLLIVSGILTGIGFYGTYTVGGDPMGVVGLILSIAGNTVGAILILLGGLINRQFVIPYYIGQSGGIGILSYNYITIPEFFYSWIGVLILAGTFIVLGVAIIAVRVVTNRPSLAATSGILSILGSGFLFSYTLFELGTASVGPWSAICGMAFSGIVLIFGFVLFFVAFILWAVVFHSSSTTIKK